MVYPGINIYVWNFQLLTVSKSLELCRFTGWFPNFIRVTILRFRQHLQTFTLWHCGVISALTFGVQR